jgi:hypothetical protein
VAIKLPAVFSPNVTAVSQVLQQCIEAGNQWKALYQQTAAAVTQKSARPWDFEPSPIFAHVDAFIQRCADLLEVRRSTQPTWPAPGPIITCVAPACKPCCSEFARSGGQDRGAVLSSYCTAGGLRKRAPNREQGPSVAGSWPRAAPCHCTCTPHSVLCRCACAL